VTAFGEAKAVSLDGFTDWFVAVAAEVHREPDPFAVLLGNLVKFGVFQLQPQKYRGGC
jgi:hypothetical protein